MPSAVLLLSGGLDSTTLLAMALAEGFDVHAMSFRYGQRHATEIEAAQRVAAHYGVRDHVIVDIDLRVFGGSALTSNIDVPKYRDAGEMSVGVPITYVPARNTIFLSFALAWAEVLSAPAIFIGVNAIDYSGYPDCRPEYIAAYERMANLATRGGVDGSNPTSIRAPLMHLSKADIIKKGHRAWGRLFDHAELLRPWGERSSVRALRRVSAAASGIRSGRSSRSGSVSLGRPQPICRDVHRQRDLLHAPGRRRECRSRGGILPLLRVQSLDRTRGGPGHGCLQFLRY